MGISLWPVFERASPFIEPHLDGKALFGSLPALDALAQRLGLRALGSFTDTRPLPGEFEAAEVPDAVGDPDRFAAWSSRLEEALADRETVAPWGEWFSPLDGIATAQGLSEALREGCTGELADARDDVLADLDELARCLTLAKDRGIRFRLEAY